MDETQTEENEGRTGISPYWWIRQIILILIAGFYLVFGIQLLVSAYRLKDAGNFILTFYASNFMILISAALLVGFVYRLLVAYRKSKKAPPQPLS